MKQKTLTTKELKAIFRKLNTNHKMTAIASAHKICLNSLYVWKHQGYEITAIKTTLGISKAEKKSMIVKVYSEKIKEYFNNSKYPLT